MKKRVLSIALVICMVAMLAMGTLAYFNATQTVTNTFSTWTTDPDNPPKPDDIFSIEVFETDPTDPEKEVPGLTFEDIKPGDVLHKDPTVRNSGKYDAWVRLTVTVTNAANWKASCARWEIADLTTIFGGFVAADWTLGEVAEDAEADTLSYTYYYNSKLAADQEATLFTTVTIPAVFDQADMAALYNFNLIIKGDAIQADNTGDSAQAAFAAYWVEE